MSAVGKESLPARDALVLRRRYSAPPRAVWRAWVEAEAVRTWFGQSRAPAWKAQMDVRVGGRFRFVMQHLDGTLYNVRGVYREVVRDRRLVFTWVWRSGPGAGEAVITVEFSPTPEGTEMVFTLDPVTDPRERDAWRADFSRLEKLLQES